MSDLHVFVLVCLLILVSITGAQVPSYFIYCDPLEYGDMMDHYHEEIEIDCVIVVEDSIYTDARIRLRGETSLVYPKKSYKITLQENQPIDGRIEWNFNSEYFDKTYMHSWLFSWIMKQLDYPCFTAEHVRLYVNGTYIGLYVRIEPIDEQFLIRNGMDPDANLYKAASDGACLSIYDNVTAYWEKKANESENWNDLYELIDYLQQVNPESIHETAGEVFELNSLMTILAVNSLTMNYSTYYHNYFMYRDIRGTGLWTMLPWDVDKTWGNWTWRSYTHGSNTNWYDNPLYEKILLDSVMLNLYFNRMDAISEQVLDPSIINPVIDSLETALAAAVLEDTADAITLDEFNSAVAEMRDSRIPGRIDALASMYNNNPRSFQVFRGDTVSLGDKYVYWKTCKDPGGGAIDYRLYLFTAEGYPTDTLEYHQLTDTCFTFHSLPPGNYIWRVEGGTGGNMYTEGYDHYNPFSVVDSFSQLSGTLQGTNVLRADQSPYFVSADLFIPSQSTLILEKGVDLRFAEGVNIICKGEISCMGISSDSVRFLADDASMSWGGIYLEDAEANFIFTSFSGSDGYTSVSQYGACIESDNSDISFSCCSFRDNKGCIKLYGRSVFIDNCDLSGWNSGELFYMNNGESATIQNSSFGNMVNPNSSDHDGIEFQNCLTGEYRVKNCEVFNIEGNALNANSSTLILEGNRVWDVEDKGFSIGIGAVGSEISNVTLTGNIVTGCYTAIAVKDDSYTEITGCTICNCDIGVRAYNKTAGSGGGNATVTNSIFDSNSTVFSIEDGSAVAVNYSLTGGSEPWAGEGNIADNPEFAGWGDYHLSYRSPCIDAGSPLIEDPDGTRSDMGAVFFPQVFDGLVINEIQSVNDTTIADDYGEYDDWFEIYNGSGYDCDLSWIYLSDDPSDLAGYQFPPGTIVPSGEYLVVWADEHPWQNGYHLPFRLSGNGDSLYISRQPAAAQMDIPGSPGSDTPRLIDFEYFGAIPPDVSFGRIPDGGAEWSILEYCTPGWSNSIPHVDTGYLQVSNPFPNPVFSSSVTLDITVNAGQTVVSVYDLAGRLVDVVMDEYLETGDHRVYWDRIQKNGGYAPTGIYLIHVRHSAGLSESRKIVILNE